MSDDNQATFDGGSMKRPDSLESELSSYGVESDPVPRDPQIDRPEPDVFGEPVEPDRDTDAGEQSDLTADVDEKQQDLTGSSGAETPPQWANEEI